MIHHTLLLGLWLHSCKEIFMAFRSSGISLDTQKLIMDLPFEGSGLFPGKMVEMLERIKTIRVTV